MNKKLMLNDIKAHYQFKNDSDFAKFLGITSQTYTNWKARNTFDAELIYTICVDINSEWLLTGKGEMLKKNAEDKGANAQGQGVSENSNDKIIRLLEQNIDALKETINAQKLTIAQLSKQISQLKNNNCNSETTGRKQIA